MLHMCAQAVPPPSTEVSGVIVPDSDDEGAERGTTTECEGTVNDLVPELMIGLTPMPTQDTEDEGASKPGAGVQFPQR